MGSVTYTVQPIRASVPPSESAGAVRRLVLEATATMGATYATGGDTITVPSVPANYDLFAVEVMAYTRVAGMHIDWNLDTTTPKLIAFDEDNTSGIEAELANDSNALAAVVVYLRFIFISGRS